MRPPPGILVLLGISVLAAFSYPLLAERALNGFGPRAVGVVVALLALAPVVIRRGAAFALVPTSLRVGLLLLPVVAVIRADALFLRLVPAALQAAIAAIFLASLRNGGSILQQAARTIHPYAPDFIGPYCRKATLAFAAIIAIQAVIAATLAVRPSAAGWTATSSLVVWVPLAIALPVEWFVRKSWFRYYGDGPVDRLLRAWLPPEKTARGRRSRDYVLRMRRELGMPPP
jgi:uncharacterized membrane protein